MTDQRDPWLRFLSFVALGAGILIGFGILLVVVLLLLLVFSVPARGAQPAADAYVLAWRDAQRLAKQDQLYAAYAWVSDKEPVLRWRTWSAVAGQVNGLSLSRRIVSPPLVLADGSVRDFRQMTGEDWGRLVLMRIDLRAYRQTREQWDKLGWPELEPFFHVWTLVPDNYGVLKWVIGVAPAIIDPLGVAAGQDRKQYVDAVLGLRAMTGAETPIVEARNFIWQVAIDENRPAGYYSWLGIKDQKSFERLVRFQKDLAVLREAVDPSGVSRQPRAVERVGRGDGTWYTFDQADDRAIGNRNPLLQMDRRKHKFAATEAYGRLDNDWWAKGLWNNRGELQQSAPDGVGGNRWTVSNDFKIHVNLACDGCHDHEAGNGGLKPFVPHFRNLYAEPGPIALPLLVKNSEELVDQYVTALEGYAESDRQAYARAVFQACGLTPQTYARNLYDTFHDWDRAVDLEEAAWNHGVDSEQFVAGLQASLLKYGKLDNVNANWVLPPERRQRKGRDQVTEGHNRAELYLRGLTVWPDSTKAKLVPVRK